MTNEIPQSFTVIIVGGGPAAISAAMGLLEARIDCLLIDKSSGLGGQVPDIPSEIANLATVKFKNGQELAFSLQQSLARAQELAEEDCGRALLTLKQADPIVNIEPQQDFVLVQTDKEHYKCSYLLVATGYRVKALKAPGPAHLAKHWLHQSDQLPGDISQTSLAIIGGGDSALLKALSMAGKVKEIHLIVRAARLRARPDVVHKIKRLSNCKIYFNSEIIDLLGAEKLERVVLNKTTDGTKSELAVDAVLVKVGYLPNTEILQNKITLDKSNHVVSEPLTTTSHGRVFAAGDILNQKHARIASAIGQGMMASGLIIENVFAEQFS